MAKKLLFIVFIIANFFVLNVNYAQAQGIPCAGGVCQANPGWGCTTGANPMCIVPGNSVPNSYSNVGIWSPKNGLDATTSNMNGALIADYGNRFGPGNSGATGQALGMMAMLYKEKPASTMEAIAMFKENVLGVKPAYAQGYGFRALSPIAQLWQLSRNIALGGFVIIMVIIGIMIILRNKIDPRTVITVQQALPKMVISLFLVLFSYAIVGLMIDAVNVLTRIGVSTLQAAGYLANPSSVTPQDETMKINNLLNANIFELFQDLYNVDVLIANLSSVDDKFNIIASVLSLDLGTGGSITRLVLWVAVFISVIRTFFMLLTSYLSVVLTVILSPFKFLFMAIPGQQEGFGEWFKGVIAHLLVFPVVLFMLAFAAIFMNRAGSVTYFANPSGTQLWSVENVTFNADTPFWAPPGLGNWYNMVGPLLGLGIILTTPKAIQVTRELVNPKFKPGASEGAASEGLQKAASRIPMLGSFTKA